MGVGASTRVVGEENLCVPAVDGPWTSSSTIAGTYDSPRARSGSWAIFLMFIA